MQQSFPDKPIAHIIDSDRIPLFYDHVRGTTDLAEKFAPELGCGEWKNIEAGKEEGSMCLKGR